MVPLVALGAHPKRTNPNPTTEAYRIERQISQEKSETKIENAIQFSISLTEMSVMSLERSRKFISVMKTPTSSRTNKRRRKENSFFMPHLYQLLSGEEKPHQIFCWHPFEEDSISLDSLAGKTHHSISERNGYAFSSFSSFIFTTPNAPVHSALLKC